MLNDSSNSGNLGDSNSSATLASSNGSAKSTNSNGAVKPISPSSTKSVSRGFFAKLKWFVGVTTVVALFGSLGAAVVRTYILPSSSQPVGKDGYTLATNIASQQEIDRVIAENVKLSEGFDRAKIIKKLTAMRVDSGGTEFIIFRFTFPQTCGRAGCLHVVVDRHDRVSMPLQLFDLSNRAAPFSASTKTGCLSVGQPSNGSIESYEICKPN